MLPPQEGTKPQRGKEMTMERIRYFVAAALCAIMVLCLGGNAWAQDYANRRSIAGKCMLWDGHNGRITDQTVENGRVVIKVTSNHRVLDIWFSAECGEPDDPTPNVDGVAVAKEKEGDKLSDHYLGWRMIFRRDGSVKSESADFDVKLPAIGSVIRVHVLNKRTIEDIDNDATRAREKAAEALKTARKPRGASEVRKIYMDSPDSWMTKKLTLTLGGLYAFKTAGKRGGGAMIALTGDVWRPGRFFRLGVGVKMNVVNYQLNFLVPAGHEEEVVNPDEEAQQIDAALYVEPRVDLWGWGSIYGQLGFGGRILTMPDAIPFQTAVNGDQPGWVRQIEGGPEAGGIFFVRIGGTFWFGPKSPIGLDASFLYSVSLNRMTENPGGVVPYIRRERRIPTAAGVFGLKARF